MKINLLIFLLLLLTSVAYSQEKFDFEKEYERAVFLSDSNLDSSEVVLNTIIAKAKKGKELEYAARAYNLKAFLYFWKSDAQKCVEFANKSYELSEKINYSYGKALALKTLATQAGRLGAKSDALQKMDTAIELLKDDTSQEGYKVRGNVYTGYYSVYDEDFEKQKYYNTKSIENYEKLEEGKEKARLLASIYKNRAFIYSGQKKFDSAEIYIKKSLVLQSDNDVLDKIQTFYLLAANYEQQKNDDSAIFYYKKSLDLARKYNYKEFETNIIKNLPSKYAALKDTVNQKLTFLEKDSLMRRNDSINKQAVNTLFVDKENSFKAEIEKQESRYNVVLWSAVAALILLSIFIIYHFRQRKKYKQMVQKIYEENQLRKKKSGEVKEAGKENLPVFTLKPDKQSNEADTETSYEPLKISPEIEERILKSLDKFEKNHKYNEKGVSLYNMANSFNVNTKYLSAIIRKHRGLSFNKYISQLRINYIVDQLLNEPKFLKYRIQHLAELSGFSSHSAFSAEFKNLMGMHPSVFIRELKSVKE